MKYTLFVVVLFTFFNCRSVNASTDKRVDINPKHLSDSTSNIDTLYSQVIESFLVEMREKYGENYDGSIWIHIQDLKTRLIGVKFDNFAFKDVRKKILIYIKMVNH